VNTVMKYWVPNVLGSYWLAVQLAVSEKRVRLNKANFKRRDSLCKLF
jgi:hypothetical protein